MRLLLIIFPFLLMTSGITSYSFSEEQMNYTRVRKAYADKGILHL